LLRPRCRFLHRCLVQGPQAGASQPLLLFTSDLYPRFFVVVIIILVLFFLNHPFFFEYNDTTKNLQNVYLNYLSNKSFCLLFYGISVRRIANSVSLP
jgi:hypothetical protein